MTPLLHSGRTRLVAAVGLVLALAIAGSMLARADAEHDARRNSDRRVELAAALIGSRIGEATSLATSLRRFISTEGAAGVTNDQFAQIALRWLSPAEVPAAAWVEQIPARERADYEHRLGHVIVTPEQLRRPESPRSSYLPATLVSGYPPIDVRGIDLGREPGMLAAITRAESPGGVASTPFAARRDGTSGLFLVAQSANAIYGQLRPGAVVVFVSEETLRAAARNPAGLEFVAAGSPADGRTGAGTVREEVTVAGGRLAIILPRASITGAGAILPWLILAAGLVLAALAGALGVNAARRAKAQAELDRIFTLSPDLIAVADFEGRFTRVNPAVEQVLGYTEEEFQARPYLEFVHPDDREQTAAEAAAISEGRTELSFENRYLRKDGSYRVLEWTSKPDVDDGVMYGVARDVTDRRQSQIEQAALRRVATLAAEGVEPERLFAVVAQEVARVLDLSMVSIERYDSDETSTVVASVEYPGFPVGSVWPLDAPSLATTTRETARPARIDDYTGLDSARAAAMRASGVNAAVGVPMLVDGRVWGAIFVGSSDGRVPGGTEGRLERFADLVATAIARAESTAARELLVEEQVALRRMATLVAQGLPPADIFAAVSEEAGRLVGSDTAAVVRFEHDPPAIVVVGVGQSIPGIPIGTRSELDDGLASTEVYRTGRPARIDTRDWASIGGPIHESGRRVGLSSTVASPISVEGRLWGTLSVSATAPLPLDTEERLEKFSDLVATAIANAEGKSELAASRRRIVAASDEARRRIERDLHDGVQQQLVSLSMKFRSEAADASAGTELKEQLTSASDDLGTILDSLVEIARGIHPAILSQGGLQAALRVLARRSTVPVELNARIDGPLPDAVDVAAYYMVSEALTNVAKYARASLVSVDVTANDRVLTLAVRDDGIGGATLGGGSGLLGLKDRAEALGGSVEIDSPPGRGTLVFATLPIATEPSLRNETVVRASAELESPSRST